ncbi:MAG TPA: glycosyltransferase family 2 protein [Rhizomicrobium sp.]|jgi:glycosyltransferase involved in cell wall biosynthesis|nr:glycosyltransferase family 2 protein [Rhizomicrobium sp.]
MADVTPFFSVVVPAYNRAHVLERSLRSVLTQTFQDFEIVVVDDGSSDNPRAVVDAIGDPRIRFLHQENQGGAAARNTGIDAAIGRFIAFLDSDDIFLPHHLQSMHDLLDGTTNTVGYARVFVDRGDGRTILKPPRAIRPDEDMATYLLCDRGFVPTISTVVENKTAKAVKYSTGYRYGDDTNFAVNLYLAGCKFAMLDEPAAIWQDTHDPARTSSGRKGLRLEQWIEDMRPRIPAIAYHGCRGWVIAKGVAQTDKWKALKLYLTALWHRCYSPGLAVIVFLQIFLPDNAYRSLADGSIRWLKAGLQPRRRAATPERTRPA